MIRVAENDEPETNEQKALDAAMSAYQKVLEDEKKPQIDANGFIEF